MTEKEEQELAGKINLLFTERFALDLKRGNGVTLEKDGYIGDRTSEIEEQIGRLKSELKELKTL